MTKTQTTQTTLILTIAEGRLLFHGRTGSVVFSHPVESVHEAQLVLESYPGARVYCSSSVDFPEEYTTNPAVLALAAELRA